MRQSCSPPSTMRIPNFIVVAQSGQADAVMSVLVRRATQLSMRLQDLRRDAQRLDIEEGPVRCAVRAAVLRRLVRSFLHGSGKRAAKGDRNGNSNHDLSEHGRLLADR